MSKNKVNYPRVRCVTFLPLLLLIIAISLTFMPLAAFAGKKILVSSRDIKAGSTYLIGSGDMLEIIVWKEPELSRSVRVRPDGKISLPLVDDIQASQSTLRQVKLRITKALAKYVEHPSVYVMLQESGSKKIYLLGKLNAPGEYGLEKETTVLQAIAKAGGFADWADTDDIVIVRNGPEGQTRIEFNYGRVAAGKDLERNIYLQPDDVIIVP